MIHLNFKYRAIYQGIMIILLMVYCSYSNKLLAQINSYPIEIQDYKFIQADSNKIISYGNFRNLAFFYSKFDSVIQYGQGQLNIVYFGGSHVQADVMTAQMRNHFQNLYGGQNAGRGLVFPYRLAHTNTPMGYKFNFSGIWETCKNIDKDIDCHLGMAGIMASTTDSLTGLNLTFGKIEANAYEFNSLRIYHNVDSNFYKILIDSALIDEIFIDSVIGFTEFKLNRYVDNIDIKFKKTDTVFSKFELYGILPGTSNPGIILHNLGINGASTHSFLKCDLLQSQLKSIQPDLVIFGLGINDAHGKGFVHEVFEENYNNLVIEVMAANPNAAIIFVTNSDSYLRRRYVNRNGLVVQESMKRIATRHNAAVWDMFEIMGGLNAIQSWKKAGLAQPDMVHFTHSGYQLLGDLFFDAIMRSWGDYLQSNSAINLKISDELTKK